MLLCKLCECLDSWHNKEETKISQPTSHTNQPDSVRWAVPDGRFSQCCPEGGSGVPLFSLFRGHKQPLGII